MKNVKFAITVLLLAVTSALPVTARTVRDFFAAENGGIFVSLPHDTRLDMLDYYEAGRKMPMGNNFGGTAVIDTLASDYLQVRTSASSRVEILLAASKRDTVIYVVTTYMLPAADSHVAAYNKNWEILNTSKYFKMPRIQDFIAIPKGDKTRRNDLAALAKIPTFECRINPADKSITVSPTVKGTMTVEDYDKLKPYLATHINYELKNTKFKKTKK